MTPGVQYKVASRRFDSFAEGLMLFFVGIALVGAWIASALSYGTAGSWQVALSTTTTLVTFLMVFVVYFRQKRDARVIERKLDRLLRRPRDIPVLTEVVREPLELSTR